MPSLRRVLHNIAIRPSHSSFTGHRIQNTASVIDERHDASHTSRHDSVVYKEDLSAKVNLKISILDLPVELIQHVTSFLPRDSAASLCLSNRHICYAIGIDRLQVYLDAAKTKQEKRANLTLIERAFPGHWFCAWCDEFHKHERAGGPKSFRNETKRECARFNSYIHVGKDFCIAYHHIRLALHRHHWGSDYGISLEDFSYERKSRHNIWKVDCPARLTTTARIVDHHLLLNARYSVIVPISFSKRLDFYSRLWNCLPHIITGHRSNLGGHTGMLDASRKSTKQFHDLDVALCLKCATDYLVTVGYSPSPKSDPNIAYGVSADFLEFEFEVWRDLGDGRTPFETLWRSHGESVKLHHENYSNSESRLVPEDPYCRPGTIKAAFEEGRFPKRYGVFGYLSSNQRLENIRL